MAKTSYKTERKVTLIAKNATVEAVLKDLSVHEAGVLTPRGAKEGTELELKMEIPAFGEFTELVINTTVTHRHNLDDEIYLKLSLTPSSDFERQAIEDFLKYKQRLIDMGKRPTV